MPVAALRVDDAGLMIHESCSLPVSPALFLKERFLIDPLHPYFPKT